MTTSQPLTAHLLSTQPLEFQKATQAPFLQRAGQGTLSREVLQQWLSQDRLYAQAYVRFASLLLANIPLPGIVDSEHVNELLADLVLGSICNVRKELRFFGDVAGRYGLDVRPHVVERSPNGGLGIGGEGEEEGDKHTSKGGEVSEGVQLYREVFEAVGTGIEREGSGEGGGIGILEGMVLLWGTEKCYLEAWRYAASHSPTSSTHQDEDGGALRAEFIPNWTSPDFVHFVDQIEVFTNKLWESEQGLLKRGTGDGENRDQRLKYLEGIWRRVLEAEVVFWPAVKSL